MLLAARQVVKRALSRGRAALVGPHVEGLLCRAGEHRFMLPLDDFTIGRKIAYFGEYNREELDTFARLIRDHEVSEVAFIGSHVGYFVVKIAALVERVVAVEANPRTFELLDLNVRLNGASNVRLIHMAATASRTELEFVFETENTGSSHVRRKGETAPGATVLGDRFDAMGAAPQLAVIDTEGHEIDVLQGMAETLPRLRAISCELIPALLDRAGRTVAEQIDLLRPHFDVYHVDSLDAPRLTADEAVAWFEALRADDRAISRNVIAYAAP